MTEVAWEYTGHSIEGRRSPHSGFVLRWWQRRPGGTWIRDEEFHASFDTLAKRWKELGGHAVSVNGVNL